jgi:hypothetical protein
MFNCNRYPKLDTYEKAVAHHNSVTPMSRGDCQGFKPIHLRSHYHKYDLIMMDGDAVVWVDKYAPAYTAPDPKEYIAKWLPNGEIHLRAPMHNCVQDRLWSLFGLNFYRHNNALWVNTHTTYRLRERSDAEPNIFKRDGSGHLQLTNQQPRSKMLLKRAQANNVRSRYSDFRKYLAGNIKVRDNGAFTMQECFDVFGVIDGSDTMPSGWWSIAFPWSLRNIKGDYRRSQSWEKEREEAVGYLIGLITSDDHQKFYQASLWVMHSSAGLVYGGARHATERGALKLLDEVLFFHHRDEVFYEKVLAHNDRSRDVWGWVFD